MPAQDTSRLKERILQVLRIKGPNFPSPIASEIQTSILFTSAFLSELLSDKQLKITNMKVGSSPIYYIHGQEERLESFAKQYLKSKEKDAFMLLNEKKFLKDTELEPAIRVALRSIKDFAIPIEKNNELYWKYYLENRDIPEDTISKIEPVQELPKEKINTTEEKTTNEEKPLEIFDKPHETKKEETESKKEIPKRFVKKTPRTPKKKISSKKTEPKANEQFFNIIKEYLSRNNTEISDIIGFSKTDLFLKVRNTKDSSEYLLAAYNKKKISEKEILEAYKKASELNLDYTILSPGETSKKLSGFIDAIKKVKGIKKID